MGGVIIPILQTRNPGLREESHSPEAGSGSGSGIQVEVPARSGQQSLLPCLGERRGGLAGTRRRSTFGGARE